MKSKMHFGASVSVFRNAHVLRQNPTPAEWLLWERLKNNQLGCRFRRQHPMSSFVADFYCHKHKLIIELDGKIHLLSDIKANDEMKQSELELLGLHVLRFKNEEVINDIEKVVNQIKDFIASTQF
jgi:cyclase